MRTMHITPTNTGKLDVIVTWDTGIRAVIIGRTTFDAFPLVLVGRFVNEHPAGRILIHAA